MKKSDMWVGKKGFRYWYYLFRDSQYYALSAIIITILICLVLVFNIIIPELTQWFSIRNEVVATRQQIATLQQNINFMNNLDKNKLDAQLQTVSHAMPPEKNFGFILSAVSNAAANSDVSLNDYAFDLGNIDSSQGQFTDVRYKGLSVIAITVIVNGNIDNIRRFIKALENNLPVSEVTSVNGGGENVSITVQFYQKPFPSVNFSADTPLEPISQQKVQLLQELSTWDNTANGQSFSTQSGSGSAVPLF